MGCLKDDSLDCSGRDFDRYLLQELLEQVDIKEIGLSGKAAKEKTDAVKMTLLL